MARDSASSAQLPGDPMLRVGSVAVPEGRGSGREGQRGRARDFRAEGGTEEGMGGCGEAAGGGGGSAWAALRPCLGYS